MEDVLQVLLRKYAICPSSGWSVEYFHDFSWLGALVVINF